MRRNARMTCAALLLLLALNLTACCATSTAYVPSSPALTQPPPLTEPLPSVPYSDSARDSIKTWRNAVTGTSTTSAR